MLLNYLPIFLFFLLAVLVALVMVGLSRILGPHKPSEIKFQAYECGMEPIEDARTKFSIKFYVIAMLFIIFDIEIVFLYPWAIYYRQLDLFGFIEMGVFIGILLIGLIYAWKRGALEWE
ncbi:MAG: NADH-quinone oxidoreductase subunit A [Thermodesulfobacteriota bacterium]|nr:NADH-quinone oxidoreductase subunit A [Thermodesulfobacteriota bacterium]